MHSRENWCGAKRHRTKVKPDAAPADKPVVLIGFMGAGKSAVGRALAARLNWEFVDTDQAVEAAAGKPVARIFAEDGEAVFRSLEREAIRQAVSCGGRVIAAGGGATVDGRNRRLLLEQAYVVLLAAEPEAILERVRPLETRPMLAGWPDPLERIRSLLAERSGAYAEYHWRLDTSRLTPEEAAEQLAEWVAGRKAGS